MDAIPTDRDIVISYVNLLRRCNIQHLTLMLNNYWAQAAFDLGPLNYSKINFVSDFSVTNLTRLPLGFGRSCKREKFLPATKDAKGEMRKIEMFPNLI